MLEGLETDLDRFGERVATEVGSTQKKTHISVDVLGEDDVTQVWHLGQECEAEPPWLEQTDAWGNRVDRWLLLIEHHSIVIPGLSPVLPGSG